MTQEPKNPIGRKPDQSIRDACVTEAMSIVASRGLEGLSLRAVARQLGVSHQAPYKHFATRDHLLAEVIRRCLQNFAEALRASSMDADGRPLDPIAAMQSLGSVYLDYATRHSLEYRLMFGSPWPAIAHDVGLGKDARAAFDVLCERLSGLAPGSDKEALDLDAMYVWASIHGVASVIESEAMKHLDFNAEKSIGAISHAMKMIERAVFFDRLPGQPVPDIFKSKSKS